MSECVREWARVYQERGLGICKLRPGQKRPNYKKWNRQSLPPELFRPCDSIGLLSGRLSGDLVCVDIDCLKALEAADRYLPATGMVEGRPGKPRSHRWYKVVDVPEAWTAKCAGGIGDRGRPSSSGVSVTWSSNSEAPERKQSFLPRPGPARTASAVKTVGGTLSGSPPCWGAWNF